MKKLQELYLTTFGVPCQDCVPLPKSGSNRAYFRLTDMGGEHSSVGVVGTDLEENKAFCRLAQRMESNGIPVPHVYAVSEDCICYLQTDLGGQSLYDAIRQGRESGGAYNDEERELIKNTITQLPDIQIKMDSEDVFNLCHPFREMNRMSVMFDLNYFKYCFLKLMGLEFNEVMLQEDFEYLADTLLQVEEYGFQYRDFQARNVMLVNGRPYFIDFQGGRKGPIYYDLASFLWQASSRFSKNLRDEMVAVYLLNLKKYRIIDESVFQKNLNLFVFFRTLQVLGAYGFRGLWEKKQHFIDSIPAALTNLQKAITPQIGNDYPYLTTIAQHLITIGK